MSRQPKRICRTRIVLSSIETGWAGGPDSKEVNRATEGGCPGSLAFGDPGDREPQPDHSRISDVPVVSLPTRLQPVFWTFPESSAANQLRGYGRICDHSFMCPLTTLSGHLLTARLPNQCRLQVRR